MSSCLVASQTNDAKHQQANAIADRLLKEFHAGEAFQNDDELLLDKFWPSSTHERIDHAPLPKDSHVMHFQLDEDAGPELDSLDDILTLLEHKWIEESSEQHNDGKNTTEHSCKFDPTEFLLLLGEAGPAVVKHVPVTDDRRMKAEDH